MQLAFQAWLQAEVWRTANLPGVLRPPVAFSPRRYCALLALVAATALVALAWNVLRRRRGWTPSALRARAEPYVRRALVGCKVCG